MLKRAHCESSRKREKRDGTLRLIIFVRAATCTALTLRGDAGLAHLLQRC
ncbi:hypothetical protein [Streptomyces sp. NPDC048196]